MAAAGMSQNKCFPTVQCQLLKWRLVTRALGLPLAREAGLIVGRYFWGNSRAGQKPRQKGSPPFYGSAMHGAAMDLTPGQLQIASRIDAQAQTLITAGHDDLTILTGMLEHMPDFKRLLDAGQGVMDELCRLFVVLSLREGFGTGGRRPSIRGHYAPALNGPRPPAWRISREMPLTASRASRAGLEPTGTFACVRA